MKWWTWATFLDMDGLKKNYNQSWLDMAMMDGPDGEIMAGVWERVNGKSLVWYPKDDFEAAGYEIPTTWDELLALTQLIADDGDTPWCVGIEERHSHRLAGHGLDGRDHAAHDVIG